MIESLMKRLPGSSHIAKVFVGLAAAALIHTMLRRRAVQRIKDEITSSLSSQQVLLEDLPSSKDSLKGEQDMLVKEQLSRNYAFLGNAKQDTVCQSFVIVVGLGGVGSHAVRSFTLVTGA